MSFVTRKDPVGEELRVLKRKRLIAGAKSAISSVQRGIGQKQFFFFLIGRRAECVGLEPDRLVALVSGRRGSSLHVSAFLITCKMNAAESVSAGSGEEVPQI